MEIISDSESRQILKNDLLREAKRRHTAKLESADSQERERILNHIEKEVEEELRRRGLGGRRRFSSISWLGGELFH
jgi:hypothetical protein